MKKVFYSHYAKFYGIPCYFNEVTGELTGRNRIYSLILDFMIWIECKFPSNDMGFPIELGQELEEGNNYH